MNKHLSPAEASKGHNRPAVLTPDDLARDFAYIDTALAETEALVNGCPTVIEDDEDLETARSAVKRCQGVFKRLEAVRVEAKEPYLAASRITDSHFNTRKEKVAGWQSAVERAAKRYLDKKAAEELARREEEARIAAAEAARLAEEARKAEEARIAAEQERIAREQTNVVEHADADAHDGAHYNALESEARVTETRTRETALTATATALAAQKATDVKPADLARTRTGDGLSTLEEVWKFEISDLKAVLTDEVLLSFISTSEIEKAVARYVATHKGGRPLKGVRIYSDTKVRMS
jgi:hypothetical protein